MYDDVKLNPDGAVSPIVQAQPYFMFFPFPYSCGRTGANKMSNEVIHDVTGGTYGADGSPHNYYGATVNSGKNHGSTTDKNNLDNDTYSEVNEDMSGEFRYE